MSYTILCVDDRLHELTSGLLALKQAIQADIVPADSISHAEAILQDTHFDAFILDIEMSDERTTGIQLAHTIRCHPSYTAAPILFISTYSHYSQHLLASVAHSAFLPKPFTDEELIAKTGMLLGIDRYVERAYRKAVLTVSTKGGNRLELDAQAISFIALEKGELIIQQLEGPPLRFFAPHGAFHELLDQIQDEKLTFLRQIYRSIIINIEQIRTIDLSKNHGEVWLFHDPVPKPVGNRYRHHLNEFLP